MINSSFPNLLVGLINLVNITDQFWINWIGKNKMKLLKVINKNKTYYNSGITRFYSQSSNKKYIKNYIARFKSIWNNRDILIIEGEKTRVGIGNDLFNNAKSIKRIICPNENAFNVYNKILEYMKNLTLNQNTLILISLGPTATVLTYDLIEYGHQIIDFGHFDIQYEYYLRNVSKKIKIPNKYVGEVPGGTLNINPISNKDYYNQIIKKIF